MTSPRIKIDPELKHASGNNIALGVVYSPVHVTNHDDALWDEIDSCVSRLASTPVERVAALEEVQALRATYKALGKDPSRYRGSNEALLRRIAQGKGLFRVNTIVDINNLVSLESRRSVASYDKAKLRDEVVFCKGRPGESYQAIGKGILIYRRTAGVRG
ncbi:MAG: B3/4 domain-containing protein [Acidiferrobacterales bacterium]